jgi:nucleoside phosphorylase
MRISDKHFSSVLLLTAMRSEMPRCAAAISRSGSLFGHGQCRLHNAVCGIGMKSAALATSLYCQTYSPDLLLMTGFCAAALPDMRIGDLVLAQSYRYATTILSRHFPHPRAVSESDAPSAILRQGTMESFIGPVYSRKGIHPASCGVDMESFSVAETARRCHIPVIIIKAVSDIIPDNDHALFSGARLSLRIASNYFKVKAVLNRFFKQLLTTSEGESFLLRESLYSYEINSDIGGGR